VLTSARARGQGQAKQDSFLTHQQTCDKPGHNCETDAEENADKLMPPLLVSCRFTVDCCVGGVISFDCSEDNTCQCACRVRVGVNLVIIITKTMVLTG
jgi:hypothetical protein